MKTIAACLCITLSALTLSAQNAQITVQSWRIDDSRSVVWERVYESDSSLSQTDIIKHLNKYSWIREITVVDGIIFARCHNYMMDYEKYTSYISTSVIYANGKWNWAIRIDMKPGKYKVTLSNFMVDANYRDVAIVGPLETEILRNDRKAFKPGTNLELKNFGFELAELFQLKKVKDHPW